MRSSGWLIHNWGMGFLEKVYENAMAIAFQEAGLQVQQ